MNSLVKKGRCCGTDSSSHLEHLWLLSVMVPVVAALLPASHLGRQWRTVPESPREAVDDGPSAWALPPTQETEVEFWLHGGPGLAITDIWEVSQLITSLSFNLSHSPTPPIKQKVISKRPRKTKTQDT